VTAPQRYICIHGHFYQPPRENAWLEAIESQDSAAPYHDWNARINHECYAANGSARILNERDEIVRIVNNYSRMSFNFGPTLLAWMEKFAPLSYRRVLDADRASMERFGGHGSAIAQVYNHVILPLAKTGDRILQIRWGIADFEYRFGRKPEGMWLAETAVDLESLDLLAQHGIRFTILAPHQCARVRAIAARPEAEAADWQETPRADVDPTQPYLVRTGEGRSITVFFYDGPVSRAIAFEGLLNSGADMARRLLLGYRPNDRAGQLVHIATDGESYGHHHRHGDMALAFAQEWIEENSEASLTNYGQFLEKFPPTREAEIFENTSWSCSHGVERWRSDCGCGSVNDLGWNQKWRAPLRAALDALRDGVRPLWSRAAAELLTDPEAARDAYIHVILDRTLITQQKFLDRYRAPAPGANQRTAILKLMELERHIQLMYTSCGWFFSDLAGIETVQIIAYAARALELARDLFSDAGDALEADFVSALSAAHANAAGQPTGVDLYRKSLAQRSSLEDIGARYAIVALFEPQPEGTTRYCYDVRRISGEVLTSGRGRFAYGQAEVCSQITLECTEVDYAVLHLGDQNLSAAVRPTAAASGASFQEFASEIREAVDRADLPEAMRLFGRNFDSAGYSLRSLFRDDQQRILQILLDTTLAEMERTLRTIFQDHRSLLRYLNLTEMPRPEALLLAARFSLNADLRQALLRDPFDAASARQLLTQIEDDQIDLETDTLAFVASDRMLHAIEALERSPGEPMLDAAIEIVDVLRELPFTVDLWEAQNRWYGLLRQNPPQGKFRGLGIKLDFAVDELTVDH